MKYQMRTAHCITEPYTVISTSNNLIIQLCKLWNTDMHLGPSVNNKQNGIILYLFIPIMHS